MLTNRTKTIRRANSEELLLMSLFGSIEIRRAIARELERRATLNEMVETSVSANRELATAAA